MEGKKARGRERLKMERSVGALGICDGNSQLLWRNGMERPPLRKWGVFPFELAMGEKDE